MQELKIIEIRINEIKVRRKQADIKTFYSNLESYSNIVNDLNRLNDPLIKKYKDNLIENCQKEKKLNIEYIIDLSYESFMDKIFFEDSKSELQKLLLDIQRSSFYLEYKNNIKIQLMELIISRESLDYKDFIKKLKNLNENIVDEFLSKDIKDYITNCEIEIVSKELKVVKELLKKKEFGIVIDKMQKLLNEFTEENIVQKIVENYLKFLENLIEIEKQNGNKNIQEIKLFEDFLKNNRYKIDNAYNYTIKLKALKGNKNDKKEKIEEKENSIYNENDNFIQIDRNKVEDYLMKIQKCIPEVDLVEFRKCKEYIYQQIYNYEEEEKNNFMNSLKWIRDRKKHKKELNSIDNIGKIFSFFNHLNKQFTHFDISTIQLISLLILSKKLSNQKKGVFSKINAGEGKPTIIQFFAAYKALLGNKVDIVFGTSILAEREARTQHNFYDHLNITVGVVTDKNAYSLDIVFGDSTQFSLDILLQNYEFIKKRGERGYDVVIILEVESMHIDNLGKKINLTKLFSGYQSLYTFYYIIIRWKKCFWYIIS